MNEFLGAFHDEMEKMAAPAWLQSLLGRVGLGGERAAVAAPAIPEGFVQTSRSSYATPAAAPAAPSGAPASLDPFQNSLLMGNLRARVRQLAGVAPTAQTPAAVAAANPGYFGGPGASAAPRGTVAARPRPAMPERITTQELPGGLNIGALARAQRARAAGVAPAAPRPAPIALTGDANNQLRQLGAIPGAVPNGPKPGGADALLAAFRAGRSPAPAVAAPGVAPAAPRVPGVPVLGRALAGAGGFSGAPRGVSLAR